MWEYAHSVQCGDILTWIGVVVVARSTVEVRKPRDIGEAIRAVHVAESTCADSA
jgi:hypothetical protein